MRSFSETALEDAATPLGRALRLCHLASGQMDQAAVWHLSLTKQYKLREHSRITSGEEVFA